MAAILGLGVPGAAFAAAPAALPDWLAARADRFYETAYWLHQGAIGVDHATGADLLAGELQDRAIAIYGEFTP